MSPLSNADLVRKDRSFAVSFEFDFETLPFLLIFQIYKLLINWKEYPTAFKIIWQNDIKF